MAGSVVSIFQGAIRQPRQRWSLNRTALDALLAALDANGDRASEKYTALHDRLVRFFQWHNVDEADALADEVLDRLARRIADQPGSSDEAVKDPARFASGIARLLLHEHWRQRQRQDRAMREMQRLEWHADGEMKEQTERMASALDRCLQHLNPAQRELIEKYYGTEGQNQIEARKQLAEQFKISLNALRNRAMRIRADLERRTSAALAK